MTKIEKDIPLPGPISDMPDTIRRLEPGESCFFDGRSVRAVQAMVSNIKAEFGRKRTFTTRSIGSGIRVWRIT